MYLLATFANMCGWVVIPDALVLGLTIGTTLFCLAAFYDNKPKFKFIINILGASFIIIIPVSNLVNELLKEFDSNTWTLLSLSMTFLSNYSNKVNRDKIRIERKKESYNKTLAVIEEVSKKLRQNNGGRDITQVNDNDSIK